jgi:putative acetyltransferase
VIRPYTPEDREAVLDVWYASAQVAHPFWPPERFDHERRAIAEEFLPRAETHVFERAGTVVGFISLLGAEVGGLFVTPRHHREGIGRALMDTARATREHLELDVFAANVSGRAFYERYGFRVVGERVDEATGLRVLRLHIIMR